MNDIKERLEIAGRDPYWPLLIDAKDHIAQLEAKLAKLEPRECGDCGGEGMKFAGYVGGMLDKDKCPTCKGEGTLPSSHVIVERKTLDELKAQLPEPKKFPTALKMGPIE